MIKRMSHATIYCLDQDRALEFYTKKLGFEVRIDAKMQGFRWLTIGLPGQPDLEIALMEPKPGFMFDEETVGLLRRLIEKGALGAGVLETDDCKKTAEELKKRGVVLVAEPEEKPYGIEA